MDVSGEETACAPEEPLGSFALRDCLGASLSLDHLFGVLLHRAPRVPFTARELRPLWEAHAAGAVAGRPEGRLHGYIHVPFCSSRCTYCQFYSETPAAPAEIDEYFARRLFPEMEFFGRALAGVPLEHLSVGGGSPSLLSEPQLEQLMAHLRAQFALRQEGVAVFECNPRHVTREHARLVRRLGFTRISMGVQSLTPTVLRAINRGYQTDAMVRRAVAAINEAGFRDGLNVDLIAGFAGEDAECILSTFEELARLAVDSIHINLLHQVGSLRARTEAGAPDADAPGLAAEAARVAAPAEERRRLFAELARRLPAFVASLGYVFRPLCGPLTPEDDGWGFWRRDPGGAVPPHSYGHVDEDDMRLPLLDNAVLAFGPEGRSRPAGRGFYWDRSTLPIPFSPDEPLYEGYRIDERFYPVWRLLIELRRPRVAPAAALRERCGAAAVAMMEDMQRRAAHAAGDTEAQARIACVCQLGGCVAADGNWLDLSTLFEHAIEVTLGARRLRFRLERARARDHHLLREGELALQLDQQPSDDPALAAVERRLFGAASEALGEVAAAHGGACLADAARAFQRALARRLARARLGPDAHVAEPEVRSFLASSHVLKCIL